MIGKPHKKPSIPPRILWLVIVIVVLGIGIGGFFLLNSYIYYEKQADENGDRSQNYWREILTPEQYHILREAGTEKPYSGRLNDEKRTGTYYSFGCDKPLFRSEQKYDSKTGWPSFWAPINENALTLKQEPSMFDNRIEVLDTCGSHLGHVFNDGPKPTGKRYCMNSAALYFIPD